MYFEELNITEGQPFQGAEDLREMARGSLEQRLAVYLSRFGETVETTGMSQDFIDSLDRVEKKRLDSDDECAICATEFLQDKYPLVVALPCPGRHRFDLECVGPWLLNHSTCPICRQDLLKKKPIVEDDDEEDYDDMYG